MLVLSLDQRTIQPDEINEDEIISNNVERLLASNKVRSSGEEHEECKHQVMLFMEDTILVKIQSAGKKKKVLSFILHAK